LLLSDQNNCNSMKTKLTLLVTLFFFVTIHLFAQKPAKSLIIGSWQETGPIGDSSHGTYCTVISFYKNNVYQIKGTHSYPRNTGKLWGDTLNYEAGKWKLKRHGKWLIYSAAHGIPLQGSCYSMSDIISTEKVFICKLNDTCLIISDDKPEANSMYSGFTRIPALPIIQDNYKIRHHYVDSTFVLVNSLDTSKKKIIRELDYVNLKTTHINKDTSITISNEIKGNIKHTSDTSLTLEMSEETIFTDMKNGFNSTLSNYYAGNSGNDSIELRTLKIRDIDLLKYRGKGRKTFNNLGSMFIGFSLTTIFIVAPFASINFKKGKINSTNYLNILAAGAAQLVIGIPLSIIGREKKIRLTSKNAIKQGDYWYFK